MIDLKQMREEVIRPALKAIDLWSEEAEELVLYTGYVESLYKYVAQVGGPARSFWQVEPLTAIDIYTNYLYFRDELLDKVHGLVTAGHKPVDTEFQLTVNMAYAAAMCRLVYRRSPLPLPDCGDTQGQAFIWKKVYNTVHGAGTEEKFITLVEGIK